MVADDNHIAIGVDFVAAHRQQVHGNVHRAADLAKFELPGFAHIQQDRLGAAGVGQPVSQLSCANLFHQNEKLSFDVPPSSAGMTVSNRLTVL